MLHFKYGADRCGGDDFDLSTRSNFGKYRSPIGDVQARILQDIVPTTGSANLFLICQMLYHVVTTRRWQKHVAIWMGGSLARQKLSNSPAAAKAFLEQLLKSPAAHKMHEASKAEVQLKNEKDIADMRQAWEEVTGSELVEVDGDYWHLVSDAAKKLLPSAGAFLAAGQHFGCQAAAGTGWPTLPKETCQIQ